MRKAIIAVLFLLAIVSAMIALSGYFEWVIAIGYVIYDVLSQ